MHASQKRAAGFTVAELLLALALTALLMTAVAYAMHSAGQSNDYNRTKAELVARARGVLDRVARDIRCAEATIVVDDGSAVNCMVVRDDGQGGTITTWRQYRRVGDQILVYEDTSAVPLPPDDPEGLTGEVLTADVSTFHIETLIASTRSVVETLTCRITSTCGPNAGNQLDVPMEEGPYVLKLSQTQYDELRDKGQLHECVDVDPRPSYEEDDDPDTYWLCLEDAKAPEVALYPGDWDFNDFMLKVTENAGQVEMEVHWGTAAYDRDVLGPDGELLYGDVGGTHTYTYVPYCVDADTVRVDLGLERDEVETGGSITATQRKALY